ncbi:MAG: DNA cytosine methyltransferase [Candidatus Microbacterium colombiense]|nr:MAG: DNA cytosine methyltransferase [Microbacterium sp.]
MNVGYTPPAVDWNGLTVTDLFCGAGGSSSGLREAGYRVVIAANHWALAIESHQINHPETDHSQADISQVNPAYFPKTHVLWGSPECTNHSIAKGIKRQRQEDLALFELDGTAPRPDEAANRSRATMWDIPRFAEHHRYQAIILENVVDAYRWDQFEAWQLAMRSLDYRMQFVWLNSMHAQIGGLPAPQSRDRMYIVMWREDLAKRKKDVTGPNIGKWTRPMAVCPEHGEVQAVQAFKKAEHWGRYRAQYLYRCPQCFQVIEPGWLAAESIIDWSLPALRIGDRAKPLAEKTRERIRRGIERHWAPIIAKAAGNTYDGVTTGSNYLRVSGLDAPMPAQMGTAEHGLAIPPLVMTNNHANRARRVNEELPTVTTATNHALIVNHVSGADASRSLPVSRELPSIVAGGTHASLLIPVEGREGKSAASVADPIRTQSTRNETGLLVPLRNHGVAKPATHPIDTVSAEGNHHALVMRNNEGGAEMSTSVTEPIRALTTHGHQSLIEPSAPISLDIDDAGFRMLEPHEIQAGMGFARDYLLLGSKRDKVKQAGNAVTPPAARDLGHAVAEFLLAVAA